MTSIRVGTLCGILAALPLVVSAGDDLGPDKMALLQDSGGWEYLSMNDSQNGFPTQHVCFDGNPHPDACSGTLTLTSDNRFVQKVLINHQSVARSGTYQLDGNQLAFFDEFGTRDGPYTIDIDTPSKSMNMDMPQIKVRLMLYKEYRKQLQEKQSKQKTK